MIKKQKTYGYGFDLSETQNHFFVIIPKDNNAQVEVFERFEWTPSEATEEELLSRAGQKDRANLTIYDDNQIIQKSDVLRIRLSKHKWNLLVKDLSAEFNNRLKENHLPLGKFAVGGTPIERLFGKEMMVLLWGIEDCDPTNIPTAIRNWKGLMPEERWWLYTMTNASTGGLNDKKGWRKALRYALCENPIDENPQMTFFELLDDGSKI